MGTRLGYDLAVRTILLSALVGVLGVFAAAQINGVPPSVTSFGPGRGPTPGVAASVTSLGPREGSCGNKRVRGHERRPSVTKTHGRSRFHAPSSCGPMCRSLLVSL